MQVKDRLYSWLIQNIIIPKMEILDKPGFIVSQFTNKGEKVYLRETFFPEVLLSDIEKRIVEEYGEKGKQSLYSAGKKFGYRYAMASKFVRLNDAGEKRFRDFCYNFVRFAESMYAKRIRHKVDLKRSAFQMWMDNYMACRLNGFGYLLSAGATAGVWAYVLDNPEIEAVQVKCQGRGDDKCEVLAQPYGNFLDNHSDLFVEEGLNNLEPASNYECLNTIQPAKFSKNSCKTLLDSGVLKYERGIITLDGERYVLNETSFMYLLELEVRKLPRGEEILFKSSYDYFKEVGTKASSTKFAGDVLSALGWGDVLVTTKSGDDIVYSMFFPWTKFANKINFSLYRGMMSGFLSGVQKRNIILKTIETSTSGGHLDLILKNKNG